MGIGRAAVATWFGCDPDLASASASELGQIRDLIQPLAQAPDEAGGLGVPDVQTALSAYLDVACRLGGSIGNGVDGASQLFGQLATGAQDVDRSLLQQLGLV